MRSGWEQIEKVAQADVEKELAALGVPAEAAAGILGAMALRSLDDLKGVPAGPRCSSK